jgi:succinoglycan biosynthesis protein ExoL
MAERNGKLVYLGPDTRDSNMRRRITQWRDAGFRVSAFAFSRGDDADTVDFDCADLGRVRPLSRFGRLSALLRAGIRLIAARQCLAEADIIMARNLDNLALALLIRWAALPQSAIVYEVVDVNASLTRVGWRGTVFRCLERACLSGIDLLVVSSPQFVSQYYGPRLGYDGRWLLVENKVARSVPPWRPRHPAAMVVNRPDRWRIGWFGYLDDEGSWRILRQLAETLPDAVEILVRGLPYTNFDMDGFLRDVGRLPNVRYEGAYANPRDLPTMFEAIDLVWSIDCNALSTNSKWLLTNSIYEAGFFGKPALGLKGTAVGDFIDANHCGWCLAEPLEASLPDFIRQLDERAYRQRLAELDRADEASFRETDEMWSIWRLAAKNLPPGRSVSDPPPPDNSVALGNSRQIGIVGTASSPSERF